MRKYNFQLFSINLIQVVLWISLIFFMPRIGITQVVIDQVDDFNDGTLQGWTKGQPVDTFVTNQSNQLKVSTINNFNGGPHSKLIIYNETQWKGDYISQGITGIKLKISNPYNPIPNNNPLRIRIAIGNTNKPGGGGSNLGTWFVSKEAIVISPDSGEVTAIISVLEEDLNIAHGMDSYASVFGNVAALRITASTSPTNPRGDDNMIASILIDDITACGCVNTEIDLSDDRMNPTLIAFSETLDTLSNCQEGADPGPRDIDYFTFNVPENNILNELVLKNYEVESSDNQAFIGIQEGTTFTIDPFNPSANDLLGGLTYGTSHIGMDILPLMGNLGSGFTPPLPAGDYTIWLNQTGPISCATFQFTLTTINNCPDTLTFTNETIVADTYKAADIIKTIGNVIVADNSTVNFQAGKAVHLNNGFHAVAGSNFSAQIIDCSPVASLSTIESKINHQSFPEKLLVVQTSLKVYPNPFYHTTTIEYQLNKVEEVELYIYSLSGKLIKTMVKNERQPKGIYQYDFSKENLPEGMYLLYLKTEKEQLIKKIMLMD